MLRRQSRLVSPPSFFETQIPVTIHCQTEEDLGAVDGVNLYQIISHLLSIITNSYSHVRKSK